MKTFALNGKWIEETEHIAQTHTFQFGMGLFETIRVQDGQPLHWDAHMGRLLASGRMLGLDAGLDAERLECWTQTLLAECGQKRCGLKILWSLEGKAYFYIRPLEYTQVQRENGLKATLGEIRRNPYSRITVHKTTNYLDNVLERRIVKEKGFDEAILLNTRDEVAEGTTTNVFIQVNGTLITPPLDTGILPGVQRKAVLQACRQEGVHFEERAFTLEEMAGAQGIYLTNALMGFMPVSNFMGNCYDKDNAMIFTINGATGIHD